MAEKKRTILNAGGLQGAAGQLAGMYKKAAVKVVVGRGGVLLCRCGAVRGRRNGTAANGARCSGGVVVRWGAPYINNTMKS